MKTVTPRGYDEKTLVNYYHGWEVYGADGYGWYTYTEYVADVVGKTKGITLRPSQNPLFTHMDGMTRAKLSNRGLIE